MTPTRRHVLTGSAIAASTALLSRVPGAYADDTTAPGRPPNIVLVLADDLGYGEFGPYGQRTISTPHVDALAAEGLVFTDAYSSGTVCAPSRCSLLTGLHNGHARVRANPGVGLGGIDLLEGDTTFAEVLRARGYRTGLFGKWGFGPQAGDQPSHPNARGFDEFYGYITHGHAHDYYPTYLWRDGRREDIAENAGGAKGMFAPDRFRDLAVDFIRRNRREPFLLVMTPNLPHAPSDVPDLGQYAGEDWPLADRGHAAQVSRLDGYIGDLVAELRSQGLAEDTVVFVTSDNGPHLEGGFDPDRFDANGPVTGYKRNLYDGGVRVPLIAWSPRRIRPGTTAHVTQQTDLLPTFAALAGAAAPSDVDGRSLAPLLAGGTARAQEHLYWFRLENGNQPRAQAVDGGRLHDACEAVRSGDWKAIRWAPGRDRTVPDDQWAVELYDLNADIAERNNLAATLPAVANRLVGLMRDSWVDDYRRAPYGLGVAGPDVVPAESPREFTVTLSNGSASSWDGARVALTAPSGWVVEAVSRVGFGRLGPGGAGTATFRVTAPRGAGEPVALVATGAATLGGAPISFRRELRVHPAPPPPTADAYLSDIAWVSATNGWGPVELDTSNGRQAEGDGTPISFGGTTYEKGLGVHARSEIVYYLGGQVARFTSVVGIDDFSANQSTRGHTVAEVWGDGRTLHQTAGLRAATGPEDVDIDLSGVEVLRLVVRSADGNTSHNHTSWADAFIEHA